MLRLKMNKLYRDISNILWGKVTTIGHSCFLSFENEYCKKNTHMEYALIESLRMENKMSFLHLTFDNFFSQY